MVRSTPNMILSRPSLGFSYLFSLTLFTAPRLSAISRDIEKQTRRIRVIYNLGVITYHTLADMADLKG
jgi:hypothetical protein